MFACVCVCVCVYLHPPSPSSPTRSICQAVPSSPINVIVARDYISEVPPPPPSPPPPAAAVTTTTTTAATSRLASERKLQERSASDEAKGEILADYWLGPSPMPRPPPPSQPRRIKPEHLSKPAISTPSHASHAHRTPVNTTHNPATPPTTLTDPCTPPISDFSRFVDCRALFRKQVARDLTQDFLAA
ncbi:hypothetical protein E2C01_094660 [Portunus trituberculatus]|uniref:Uncharacterized protein n=1 Tax=Portunus trituberculatus TaxID=210409 RepID=A0A5B7K1F7_PORTR|nr:hypothetical protein [Portunus trituberculatus]